MSKKLDAPVREKGARKSKTPKPTMSKAQADELAMKFTNMAKKQDQAITSVAERLAAESGTKLHGIAHRLKTPRSASRKILADNIDDGTSYSNMAKDDLSDLNRYTFILDEAKYVDEFTEIMAGFVDEGYEIVKVKNYWDGDLYKGMNVNFRALDGRKIEFQFNTKKSQFIKDKWSHKWYEEFREIGTSAVRKAELEYKLSEIWLNLDLPVGHNTIPWFP